MKSLIAPKLSKCWLPACYNLSRTEDGLFPSRNKIHKQALKRHVSWFSLWGFPASTCLGGRSWPLKELTLVLLSECCVSPLTDMGTSLRAHIAICALLSQKLWAHCCCIPVPEDPRQIGLLKTQLREERISQENIHLFFSGSTSGC